LYRRFGPGVSPHPLLLCRGLKRLRLPPKNFDASRAKISDRLQFLCRVAPSQPRHLPSHRLTDRHNPLRCRRLAQPYEHLPSVYFTALSPRQPRLLQPIDRRSNRPHGQPRQPRQVARRRIPAPLDAQVFEASSGPADTGGALGLAANGMNVLAAAGVIEQIRDVSVIADEWAFENQRGKLLACMPSGDPARRGQVPVMITRAALHRVLVDRAENQEISVSYNKRLVTIDDLPNRSIVAHFADGSAAEGDFIVGADVRQAVVPEAPKPVYTGLMAPGGFSPCIGDASYGPRSKQRTHFVFGQNGFFGYFNAVTPAGLRVVWWSTASAPLESKEKMAATTKADLQQRLLALHGDWAHPVPQLIRSAEVILDVPIHDVPSLPRWSASRTLVIGDAAHAVVPHSGQGASMALEDAIFLAKLLRDSSGSSLEKVFIRFEQQRCPRTDKVIALGRRNAQRKEKMSTFAYWFQISASSSLSPPKNRTGYSATKWSDTISG
jgi:2-polyprenyl-6-methoxyphenol hydroxylase-like FAD-dependent oxidoreductase